MDDTYRDTIGAVQDDEVTAATFRPISLKVIKHLASETDLHDIAPGHYANFRVEVDVKGENLPVAYVAFGYWGENDIAYNLTSLVKLGTLHSKTGDKSTRLLSTSESERRIVEAYITAENGKK